MIGFVYILGNKSMPNIYKVGCTERSPTRRAAELSAATACPTPFEVICFWEGDRFQEFEAELHEVFCQERVNQSREFFTEPLDWLVRCADAWEERKSGFYITDAGRLYLQQEADK